MEDGTIEPKPPEKRDLRTAVGDAKALATVFAVEAEFVLGRRGARVLGVVALFAAAFTLVFGFLSWYISPDTAQERQGLTTVVAISLGGVAAIVGLYFTRQALVTTRELEANRARDAALRACLEQLGKLLTHEKWSTKDQRGSTDDTLRNLARAETVSVLGTLDGSRKRILVRFLYESGLLDKDIPVVDLNGADLREADLRRSILPGASLSGVRLGNADLSEADLSGADLSEADLSNAYKVKEGPTRQLITHKELERQADSLEGATMPDGSKHP